jgi:hypothetical protein
LYAFLITSTRVTCPAHPILFDYITLIIFGEAYKLWSSSVCTFPHSHATSFLLGPNTRILLRALLFGIYNCVFIHLTKFV